MKQTNELPHDLLAEKSLVGCLLIDGESLDSIVDLGLAKGDFFHPKYGLIFNAIKDLSDQNRPIDFVTICARLQETGNLEELGGHSFIHEIIEDQVSSANIYHYAKIVKEKSGMREIIRTAMRVAEMGMNHQGKTEEFIQTVEESFFKLTNDAKNKGLKTLKDCIKVNLKELEDTSRAPGELTGLPTSFGRLDAKLLGMQPGQLIVIAARPGMGKTALALNMAVRSCKMSQFPVVIFSLEMLGKELSMRVLSAEANVELKRLKMKNFMEQDLRSIANATRTLSNLPIFINDDGNTTVLDIQSYCRKIKAERGLGLVVIDYLQLLRSHTSNPSREQQIAEMSRALKGMAKELDCPVVAMSQLNRSVEARPDKRPTTSDLRESGSIEQDADIVILIYRDDYYNKDSKEPGVAELIVAKNRSGETGPVKVLWKGVYTSFENLTERDN
ncbi:MAG: replicative DNA helicase [Bdellovibrio sp.]|nr:replicative DNA helicase [Bdellovibrio sp.]